MTEKDQRLLGFCTRNGCDGVWLRRRSNVAWITEGADVGVDLASTLGVASVVWTPQHKAIRTDNIEAARLRDEERLDGWTIEAADWWVPPAPPLGHLMTDWPDDPLVDVRSPLTAAELDRARTLGRDTAEVVERIMTHDARPGMTEQHLGGAVAGWLRDRGLLGHVILVAADERIAKYRHPIPTAKPIERLAMVAVCAQRQGLIVSVTRLVHFGPLPAELRLRHDAVCAVDSALHAATRPGRRWCDVLQDGIDAYAAAGFADEWKLHHQGGPMGYECRDFKATRTETRTIKPGQLVGWNPTITGTKSEDTILSTGEVLTTTGNWPLCGTRPDILVR